MSIKSGYRTFKDYKIIANKIFAIKNWEGTMYIFFHLRICRKKYDLSSPFDFAHLTPSPVMASLRRRLMQQHQQHNRRRSEGQELSRILQIKKLKATTELTYLITHFLNHSLP